MIKQKPIPFYITMLLIISGYMDSMMKILRVQTRNTFPVLII